MKIEFFKYQGTGNDFVILENRDHKYDSLTPQQVKHICNRRFGVGADGLMLLNNHPELDFEMIYFNADGNESSMCGNGGRCLVQFAKNQGMHKSTYHFMAIDGKHEADIDMHHIVRLKMQDVNKVEYHSGYAILNTGSPHFVKFADNVENIDVVQTGQEIRYSKQFAVEGINVNFVETIDEDGIFVRTYERGVEDETMSCGTGVTASALMNAHNENGFNRVEIRTPGGHLSVEYNKIDDEHFDNIWLCGPAQFVYKGEIEI
ncbi:MAG: diaminopimelate epimerase [Ferruginibacter sp.]|nr:diaminopimelate epimerase [Ferruginibacter sp.]